jgi:hypothetical protein
MKSLNFVASDEKSFLHMCEGCMRFLALFFVPLLALFGKVEAEMRPFPGYVNMVGGVVTITFQPKVSGGTGGSWQASVISPGGTIFSTSEVPYNSLDNVVLEVKWDGDLVELGSYAIQLKNNIVHDGETDFLSAIQVTSTIPGLYPTTFRHITPSFQGEAVEMFLRVTRCEDSET